MRQDGEASVEEILESIKKVIARDTRADAVETRRRRESAGVAEAAEGGPLDDAAGDEVLDLSEADFADEPPRDGGDGVEESPLTTEQVRHAMRDNFAALAMLAEPGKPPQIVRSGETSLEGLTRELLRPMLADWLDKNLPGMVEKLVKAEIARIAGKRG